jgi:hypothetical protein
MAQVDVENLLRIFDEPVQVAGQIDLHTGLWEDGAQLLSVFTQFAPLLLRDAQHFGGVLCQSKPKKSVILKS